MPQPLLQANCMSRTATVSHNRMTFIPRNDIKNPKREQFLVGGFTFGAAIVACEEMTSKDPNKIRALTPVDSSFRISIMASCNGAQQWHPMAPSNGTQWHPAMAPSNGTQWHPAMAPQQWHPAMAPSNGTQREPRQSWCPPPFLLEVRTPIAKAIWGKSFYFLKPPKSQKHAPNTHPKPNFDSKLYQDPARKNIPWKVTKCWG